MKIKELQKTINIAWSPQQQYPIYLAAGTAAQQLDWNGDSVLEIYSTNLKDRGYDLQLEASLPTQYRFQKLLWSPNGISSNHANGVLVGGCEGGHLMIYGVTKMLAGEEALIAKEESHTGPIRGLDFNPFQTNLLASAASESEIFVWDLNNTATHMTPGAKTQPYEDVQNVAWNRQVQHILATVFSSRCVIWDLRKNEQIIKLNDTQSRVRWRAVQWHPDVATQIWLASEEDQAPFIQMWDLRYATAPAKTMQIHKRGVLGMSWCPEDCNMMVSCGKDNRLYCWDPNTTKPEGEILSEVAKTPQWYSDVQWCPRNPALIASSSLDGFVSIYSLFGGKEQQVQTSNKIADSFPGMDQFAQSLEPLQTAFVQYSDPLKPPKWMKKTSGAKFGFGGKLLFFNSLSKLVQVGQTISEPDFLARALALEKSLLDSTFENFCRSKADEMTSQEGRYLWYFLKANFEVNPKKEMLNLLGFNTEDTTSKFFKYVKAEDANSANSIVDRIDNLTHKTGDYNRLFDDSAECNKTVSDESKEKCILFKIPNGDGIDSLISEAIITGNLEAAVQLCLDNDRAAEALIIASTAGIECLTKTRHRYLKTQSSHLTNIIAALVTRDWMDLVSRCTADSWKEALVAALNHNDRKVTDICEKLGDRLLAQNSKIEYTKNAMLCFICAENVEKLVNAWYKLKQLEKNENDYELCTMELQELAEIVIILSKSLEQQGIAIEPEGKFADFVSQYGSFLSAQGAISTAFTLVSALGPSAHTDLEDLKDRLNNTLNNHSCYAKSDNFTITPRGKQRSRQHDSFFSKENTSDVPTRGLFVASSFNTNLPNGLQWNPPLSTQQLSPLLPLPVSTFSSQSISSQGNESNVYPPRPSSVSSQASTTLPPRAKYLLDPSVYSVAQHGSIQGYSGGYNASSLAPESTNSVTFVSNPTTSHSSSMIQPFSTDCIATYPNAQGNYNYMQLNSQSRVNNSLPGVAPIECGAQNLSGQSDKFANMQRNPTPPPGWNDPPLLKLTRKQLQKVETSATAITHPLFGVDPNRNQNANLDPIAPYQNKSMPRTSIVDQQSETVYRSKQETNDKFGREINFEIDAVMQPIQQQNLAEKQDSIQQKHPEVAKEKQPLSEEFIYMQTVFEELKSQCLIAATDPRTKRKFVDVVKRLENLYDCLREGRLTSYTITALNQIVQYIQIGDYGNALATHTSIAFGTDFAQTASFMPGIKVLVQSASDLNVYLR